ncbi:hypothetical protein EW093_09745 [Thiospirochaeta perfilievii]|uniref:Alpha-2-macroglobulin n=1 Tax=Thiospirochaeta perfilievii TaxID=252967 RepID=A0A5C1QCB8_9SPIO|nr:alpha-2-macroglobulin family protein [Thiospirochaeta perfilievii]QEN04978.1 hypothetical protein EW093_09745 [Thiospirochaeta perfilievii]
MKKIIKLSIFLLILMFSCSKDSSDTVVKQEEVVKNVVESSSNLVEPVKEQESEVVPLVPVDMEVFNQNIIKTEASEGALLEDSIDYSSTTVNYYNPGEHDNSSFQIADDGKPLEIVDFGPTGKLPEEMQKPSVYVLFSKPMVPLSKLGEPITSFDNFVIEPALEGVYRWYGTNLLSFEASKPILADSDGYSKEYRVVVKKDIKSLTGQTLGKDFEYSFYPKEVEMVNLIIPVNDTDVLGRLSNVPYDLAHKAIVRFNMPVDLDYIKNGLDVKVKGNSVDFSISRTLDKGNRGDRSIVIEIPNSVKFTNNNPVMITLKEGAVPRKGTPQKTESQSKVYETLDKFTFYGSSTYSYATPSLPKGNRYPLYISFNQIIDKEQDIKSLIKTSLDVDLDEKVFIYGSTIHITNLPLESGDSYSVTIKEGLKDIYGQELTGGERVLNEVVPEATSYIRFPDKSYGSSDPARVGYLESQFDPGIIIQHQNLDSLSYGVEAVDSIINSKTTTNMSAVDLSVSKKNYSNFEYIDLKSFVNGMGNGSVLFNGEGTYHWYNDREITRKDQLLVQMTDIGITVRFGYNMILVWANSLSNGAPIIGADVTLYNRNKTITKTAKSDKNGLTVFNLGPNEYAKSYYNYRDVSFWVNVDSGEDKASLEVFDNLTPWRHGVSGRDPENAEESLDRMLLFSDRQLYKPGEELSFRGIHWRQRLGEFTPYEGEYSIYLTSRGYKSQVIYKTTGKTTKSGGSFGSFKLPEDIKPGKYSLIYRVGNNRGSAEIQIANFRRLNFFVTSQIPDRTFYYGDTISIPVKAGYLAGGVMPGASYSYYWTRKMINFTPPGKRWDSYIFGINSYSGEKNLEQGEGRLSGSGEAQIKEEALGHESQVGTYRYVLETTVTDIDNQQVSNTASVVVHPSSFYIGAKLGDDSSSYWSSFIKAKEDTPLRIVLVTPEGEIYKKSSDIDIELYKISWKSSYQQGVYDRVNVSYRKSEELVGTYKTKSDSKGLASIDINPETSGSYIAKIKSADDNGRAVQSDLRFYSYGGGWYYWGGDSDTISLVPDKDLYFVNDSAKIMVQSPLKEGKYLLTVEREGIIEKSIINLDEDTTMVEIPIEESYVPRVYVALTSFTNREEAPENYFAPDLGKPKNLFGVTSLDVSPITRTLDIDVAASKASYRPGEDAEVYIKVSKDGKPVANTELVYLAVDRGVVDLVNYHVPNPLKYFYNPYNFPLYTSGDDLRNYLMDPVSYDISNLQGGDGSTKMEKREDFNPLAAFEPYIKTDANGIAKVNFKLPDTLTTYRTTVIALEGNRVGYSENEILVKNPINVRSAFPRRLRLRDTGVGYVILQNNTDSDQSVTVSLDSESITFPGESLKSVVVPAFSLYKVPFLMVPQDEGKHKINTTIKSDVLNEVIIEPINVEKPLIKETFATTGKVEDGASEEGILIPEDIADNYGAYDISMYASRFGMIKGPINSLKTFNRTLFERLYYYMPDAVLGKKLSQLDITYDPSSVDSVLSTLKRIQTPSGWLKYYTRQTEQDIYLDIISLMFIINAQDTKRSIPNGLKDGLANALLNSLNKDRVNSSTVSFASYILNQAGVNVTTLVDKLLKEEESIGLTALGYLSSTLKDMGRDEDSLTTWKLAKKFVRPGTRTIDINEPYETRWYFDSEIRQISSLILAGLKLDENSDMMQRYVTTLRDRLNARMWKSNTDYLWSLIAIKAIAENDQIDSLDMNVALTLDGNIVEQKGINNLADSTLDVTLPLFESPLKEMERGKLFPIRIEKSGTGNIYYSAQINYALPSEVTLPRDEGIGLFLHYENLDGEVVKPKDVIVGTTYRVRTVISSSKRREYLTLDIPVPSGIEIIDPSFATTSAYKPEGGVDSEVWTRETSYGDETQFKSEGYWGYWWYWKNEPDQEIYDNHLTYTWDTFYEGKREITFLVRATNPGIFPTPSAQASLLFEPEVFGRTGGSLFVIK